MVQKTAPTPTPQPVKHPPKHLDPKQPQAGTVPPKAEELAHKGRSWRGR